MLPDDPRHGSDRGHNAHMRSGIPPCQACIAAHTKMNKLRELYPERFRKVPTIGARRRLQALQALGYGRDVIAEELGYSDGGSIAYIMSSKSETVTQQVDKRVREVFERLCMKPPPSGGGASRARTWAKRHGFAPPLAWDDIDDPAEKPAGRYQERRPNADVDEVVVARLLDGERVPCTTAERGEAMRRWKAAGKSERAFCKSHGWKENRYGKEVAA